MPKGSFPPTRLNFHQPTASPVLEAAIVFVWPAEQRITCGLRLPQRRGRHRAGVRPGGDSVILFHMISPHHFQHERKTGYEASLPRQPRRWKRGSTEALLRRVEEAFSSLGLEHEVVSPLPAGDAEQLRCPAGGLFRRPGTHLRLRRGRTSTKWSMGPLAIPMPPLPTSPRGPKQEFLRIFGANYAAGFLRILAALAEGPQACFDLMDCNGKLGIGVVCAGVDARVAGCAPL